MTDKEKFQQLKKAYQHRKKLTIVINQQLSAAYKEKILTTPSDCPGWNDYKEAENHFNDLTEKFFAE